MKALPTVITVLWHDGLRKIRGRNEPNNKPRLPVV
jgi:hypothetical protein